MNGDLTRNICAADRKKWRIFLTGLCLWGVVFLYVSRWSPEIYYFDAGYYFELGQSIWKDGFSLLNYPQTYRGCVLPMLIGGLEKISQAIFHNHHTMWEIYSSGICVLLVCFIMPSICLPQGRIGTRRWIIGAVLSCAFFLYYWSDLILQTLSDLSALTFYAGVILCIKQSLSAERKREAFLLGILAGALGYAAYNTRTIYLIALMLMIAAVLLGFKKSRKNGIFWLGMIIGIFVMALPQIMVNYYQYGTVSPMVNTSYGSGDNLFVYQLKTGIGLPRFESYIGKSWIYPDAGVQYLDPLGKVLSKNAEIYSIKDYVVWLATHFLEACGLYCKHLISGITLFYRNTYIRDLELKAHVFLINCFIWITALLGMRSCFVSSRQAIAGMKGNKNLPYVVMILLPVLLILPGAIETRFFLPAFSLVYVYVTMGLDYAGLWAYAKEHWMEMAVLVIAVFLVWCMTASDFLGLTPYAVMDWSGNIWPK